jgi:hypothetical protein
MRNTTSVRTRLSALAAIAAGLAWIVVGALQLTAGTSSPRPRSRPSPSTP